VNISQPKLRSEEFDDDDDDDDDNNNNNNNNNISLPVNISLKYMQPVDVINTPLTSLELESV